MERKLVSIQRVEALAPIAGADRILCARVMGWDVVVKAGEFAVGDPCVFFEIDSLLPAGRPWAEFLRPRGFRVRTVRLRGVLSQGLALPVDILEGEVPDVGVDVRERLGVEKFEPVLPDDREMAGPFPGRIPKTDEIRLQSALGVLDEIRGVPVAITTKLDGSSATFWRPEEGELVACSRNWAIRRGSNDLWRVAEALGLEERLPPGAAIQGELCGPGIQKNRLGLKRVGLSVFNVWVAGRFLDHAELRAFCAARDLPTVPIEEVGTFDLDLPGWLARAGGTYSGTQSRKEGIVVRPLVERYSPTLQGRLSFKVLNNEFLLRDED